MKNRFLEKLNTDFIYLLAGSVLSLLFLLPYLLLGKGSIITYHDQLDGELINYILGAKYLFQNVHSYPELMNGIPDTGVVPPAPLLVILFRLFTPFTAFLIIQECICLTGFFGMYLLMRKLCKEKVIAFLIAVIFMLLPFYPVYGLCIPGQPLLLFCLMKIRQNAQNKLLYYFYLLLYTLCSSLVLVGFACLLVCGIWALSDTVYALQKKTKLKPHLWISLFVLTVGYLVCNLSLIRQVLFPTEAELSHKSEITYNPTGFSASVKAVIYPGISYTETWHWILIPLGLLIALLWILSLIRGEKNFITLCKENQKKLGLLLFCIVLIILLFGVYNGSFITSLRNALGGALKSFNLERIAWLMPTLWCMITGCLLEILWSSQSRMLLRLRRLFCLALFAVWGLTISIHTPLKANISKLIKGNNYYAMDWEKFFAEDIFARIDDAIGLPKEEYRVVSIGIYPAAACYNGFYCLDGYSNNYPLEYKHEFRQIIATELEKNEYIKAYFDEWGNRCYVLTSEVPGYFTFEKKWNTVLSNLEINTQKLKEMNCQYIFSAAFLANSEELGLSLLQEEPFETENSWYHIYVYKVD